MTFDFKYPEIDPVAVWLGPLPIRWYSLAYLAGFLLGWWWCRTLAGRDKALRPTKADIDDFLVWAIVGVILGGRLGYILFYQFDMYMEDPLAIFKLWQGGMSFHGGASGVIIALIAFSLKRKVYPFALSDLVCAVVPIGLFFGRVANFINGELFGRMTDAPIGMVFPRGGPLPRHPSQLYEAALEGLALFIILQILILIPKTRHKYGLVSGAFLAGYAIFRMSIEQFREPDAHLGFIIGSISMGQILSLPMLLAGIGLMIFSLMYPHKPTQVLIETENPTKSSKA